MKVALLLIQIKLMCYKHTHKTNHCVNHTLTKLITVNYAFNYLCRYQVFRTEELTAVQAKALQHVLETTVEFDFWKDPNVGRVADIMAGPESIQNLKDLLQKYQIGSYLFIDDVQK